MHSINIIHGDVNSQNVMVNDTYEVKLIDFDNSAFEGKKVAAAGNYDFCSDEIKIAIERKKKITASKK